MWNQQQAVHYGQLRPSVDMARHQLPPPGLLMAPPVVMASAAIPVSGSSARPGSMSELARMAKIPQPEPGLKCPRCPSTNTKFCYFNNYSLTQPRYFCKACRRYWTSGGTLRNVPVGGGCRRNKRSRKLSKKPSSPSPASATAATASIALGAGASSSAAATVMPPPFPFHFGTSHSMECDGYVTLGTSRLGLFPGLNSSSSMHQRAVDYHHQLGDGLGLERSQLPPVQQFRFNIAGVQPPPQGRPLMLSGSYPFDDAEEGNAVVEAATRLAGGMPASAGMAGSSGLITQMAAVKMDNNDPTLAMGSPGELLDGGSLQFWGGGGDRGGGTGGCVASGGGWPSSDLLTFDLS